MSRLPCVLRIRPRLTSTAGQPAQAQAGFRRAMGSAVALLSILIGLTTTSPVAVAYECDNVGAPAANTASDLNEATNTACGDNAGILGNAGNDFNSAYGNQSGQQVNGDNNVAVGNGAGNVVTGDRNTAVGDNAGQGITGSDNIAIGVRAGDQIGSAGSSVSGTISIGGDGGDANIQGARASANDAIAIGTDTTAAFANSSAIGAGAATTRSNQQAFGTGTNTYTMAGIASAASKTAQGAPTHLVTSNAGGDLAAYTFAELGFASASDVSNLQSQINNLGKRDDELAEGIAISLALAQPIFHSGQTFAFNFGWGGFDGSNAVGFTAAGVVSQGAMGPGSTVTLYGGVGAGTNQGTVAGKAGASFGF